jgi:hypothetical protein
MSASPVPRDDKVVTLPSWVKKPNEEKADEQYKAPTRRVRSSWIKQDSTAEDGQQEDGVVLTKSDSHDTATSSSWKQNPGPSPVPTGMTAKKTSLNTTSKPILPGDIESTPSWKYRKNYAIPVANSAEKMEKTDDALVEEPGQSEPDGPSRFASAYVHQVVAKPMDAVRPQFRKDSTSPNVSETSSPSGNDASPENMNGHSAVNLKKALVLNHRSPWSKYNRSEPSSDDQKVPSPPTDKSVSVDAAPSEDFKPSQLRARFQALEQKNSAKKAAPVRVPDVTTFRKEEDESIGDYEDPPIGEYSEVETDVEDLDRSRVVIETPEKVSVSAMAGRFGTVRGKEPKKTPPRVVRPNDFWRANAPAKTEDQSQPTTPQPGQRGLSTIPSMDMSETERGSEASGTLHPLKEEMPSWLRERMQAEVVVTSDKALTSAAPKEVAASEKKEDDKPWWLLPKQGDEAIKKVLARAVPAETSPRKSLQADENIPSRLDASVSSNKKSLLSPSFEVRDIDFEVEIKPPDAIPPAQNTQGSSARRRLDELLEIQSVQPSRSSEEVAKMSFEGTPSRSRRLGVVQAWHVRSRGEDPEDFTEGPLGEIPTKESSHSTGEDQKNEADQDEASKASIGAASSEDVFAGITQSTGSSSSFPQNDKGEEQPEMESGHIHKSPEEILQLRMAQQPWRQMASSPNHSGNLSAKKYVDKPEQKVSQRAAGSPGASPLKTISARMLIHEDQPVSFWFLLQISFICCPSSFLTYILCLFCFVEWFFTRSSCIRFAFAGTKRLEQVRASAF